ncbi:RdgB/HAM1 family non-canonical purine NTP pyrophosphatase [Roseisolibacter sp. H3M3-2]|uniref:RdgB/HAM1 family non-canonical purine NTP pyrophosphatase n=1 Tax=Roseisolibacter sp. H3M3-2 TaxID=3031323 RepID=UPI0023DB647C|nr:RdgB/HAM1 family non-canonical purine NTP pyrophosphatase [Roseisolibacter sp. H3M3-2]MDF1505067.1 RdgB/HAM1 family non-canonical purine NTP pyrophosphatase [Roseisolibacter sp. H3M3-2]
MSTRRVVVATRNVGKLGELRALLATVGLEPVDLVSAGIPESPEEDALEAFDTFEENALAKARHFHARAGGLPVIADDSGLAVDALGGAPGVRSKRYTMPGPGESQTDANNVALVRALAGAADRTARFVCVVAYVGEGREVVRRGETAGRILEAPRGGLGFGYDPLFLSDDLGVTFAEASAAEKGRVGHRGRAFRALVAALGADAGR